MKLANEYAQKHFNSTKVAGAEYDGMDRDWLATIETTGTIEASKSDSDRPTPTSASYTETVLDFNVTDETGRVAIVKILMEAKRLIGLFTQRNDIMPGFDMQSPAA